jgi:clan AA aspartic protease (TIGR02281 family)
VKLSILMLPTLATLLAACEPVAAPVADYRPEEAGTVDHALCLLGLAAVPLRTLATGHHLVDVRLNGRESRFVLDTGANASVVDASAAEALGLPSGRAVPGAAIGLGGALKARQVRIESLEVGSVAVRQRRIMVSDLSQFVEVLGRMSSRPVQGIIGQDVMKEHRAVIDVARPVLYLMERDRDPAPVPAESCRKSSEKAAKQ